jgi:hypothetical protein
MMGNDDRRVDGVQKIVRDDGNGGRESAWVVHKRLTPWHVVVVTAVAVIGLAITVGTVAFNATRAGVGVQVDEQIRRETHRREGVVRQRIESDIREHEIESERKLNKTLSEIKEGVARIETKQETICERLERLEDRQ